MSNDATNKEGTCGTCSKDDCSAKTRRQNERPEEYEARQALDRRMCQIKHKILILSGKGGVGKSTVAVNVAVALAHAGRRVGLLDVDIHGPSTPKMLGLEGMRVEAVNNALVPVDVGGLKVMSIGFLLANRDDAVIWRGPMKMGVIRQFLKDVEWGELDYLIIDSPPGTGDEPLSVCQLIEDADGAVVVTTPQDVSIADVRRCVNFCRQLELPVLGVIENMSGFVCPHCGEVTDIFKSGGGERMALEMGVPFLGRIPIDPQVSDACDAGTPYIDHYKTTETAKTFADVVRPILDMSTANEPEEPGPAREERTVRIAIPVADGKLATHFGHCEQFIFVDVDAEKKIILGEKSATPPPHEPGVLPRWLAEQGANVIIACGMGSRAQGLFAEQGIEVVIGAQAAAPREIAQAYLDGNLDTGENICDH